MKKFSKKNLGNEPHSGNDDKVWNKMRWQVALTGGKSLTLASLAGTSPLSHILSPLSRHL